MTRCIVIGALTLAGLVACASAPPQNVGDAEPAVTQAVADSAAEETVEGAAKEGDGGPEIISSQLTEEDWPPAFDVTPYEEKLRVALKIPDDEPGESSGVHATQVRAIEGGLLIEASMMGPGPCSTAFVSSFREDGTLISAWRVTEACDCPSACEGCERWESLTWRSETSFVVHVKQLDVLGEVTEDGECETRERHSETRYEIQADGTINKGEREVLP